MGGVGVCEGRGERHQTGRRSEQANNRQPGDQLVLTGFCLILGFYMISLSFYCHLIVILSTRQIIIQSKYLSGENYQIVESLLVWPTLTSHGQDTGRRITFSSPALNNREEDGE